MIRTANVQEPYSPAAFPSLQALYSPGPLGPFAVSTLPPAFLLFYHSGFEHGSPRPIFRFGNLFRLRELPQRRQSPEGRRRIPLRRRVFSLRKRPRRRRNPGRMSKRLRTERRGRFQAGERCRQPWTRKPRGRWQGRGAGQDRAGQPDNTAQAKNGLVPAGDQAVPGESSKKCLSFSKAA